MSTIKQRTRPVVIAAATGERTITVRRLAWKSAKTFFAELSSTLALVFGSARQATPSPEIGTPSPAPNFWDQLPRIILESDKLVTHLLTGATDLTADELAVLDWGDVLGLTDAALALNTDDEIKNSCAGVMGSVLGFVGQTTTKSGAGSMPT
ncbi:MAG: hypothetical protein JSS11_08880 [Verrucomicrobia bacterium]|nr:hypothetical protein [Verrucomicrobiota bacterium]